MSDPHRSEYDDVSYDEWEYVDEERTAGWPKVIGCISVVFAALGLLSAVGMAICMPMVYSMANGTTSPQWQQVRASLPAAWVMVLWSAISLGLSVLLLVAGIMLLKRRAAGVKLHVLWAWLSIASQALGIGVNLASGTYSTASAGASHWPALIGGTVFGLAYPVFLLVWMGRRAVKDEVAGWE